jgi:hypothetical protein
MLIEKIQEIQTNSSYNYGDLGVKSSDLYTNKPEKAIVYTAHDGTKFWVDADIMRIHTDRPETFLEVVPYGPMSRWSRTILTLDGVSIEFCGPDEMPLERSLSENPDGSLPLLATWEIHGITAKDFAGLNRERANGFPSREHQEKALDLIVDILSKFIGSWNSLRHGKDFGAEVVISTEFQQQLENGELIDG